MVMMGFSSPIVIMYKAKQESRKAPPHRSVSHLPTAELLFHIAGRHVSSQEALKLGIVDQVTEQNACEVAVEFALRAVGMSA